MFRILVTFLVMTLTGCSDIVADRIESICNCNNCPEKNLEIVTAQVEAGADVAEAYECFEVLEEYWTCELSKHECQGGNYEDDQQGECDRLFNEVKDCAAARSTAGNQGYYGGQFFKHRD